MGILIGYGIGAVVIASTIALGYGLEVWNDYRLIAAALLMFFLLGAASVYYL